MESLRRVSAGSYTIEQAIPLAMLLESEDPHSYLQPIDTLFTQHPTITLTDKQEIRCRNGNAFSVTLPDGTYRAYSKTGEFLMLAKVKDGIMSTIKSFFAVGSGNRN